MVRILSNGDIVPDDDPRAQAAGSRGNSAGDNSNRPRQGYVQHDGNGQQAFAEGRQISVFEVLNQKLLAFGIPRFTFGQFVFEPIVSVGFLLAGLLFGISGLLFAGLLYFVVRWSQTGGGFSGLGGQQHGAPPGNDGNPPGAGRRGGGTFGGGSEGYRLGRS
ncbi:hypothetical protein C0Q70_01982 [Pomacea canaliculata]|uniref:DUF4605 domain-containing protein n=1 Tax=Pomacea canaliculata TaxID=400727 RepID=A0A2T7Q105_POMCA|nr:uncharacterized protein FAM241B-like isoform X1 [Pomacea canaliculata]PVD39352.1 hypothetical protein C0Q70_01982 [Pomacea canaliculata]